MESINKAELLDKNLEEMFKHMTVYIAYPNGQRYTEIVSPKAIQNTDDIIYVQSSNGTIYTAHATNVLIVTKPKEEKEEISND